MAFQPISEIDMFHSDYCQDSFVSCDRLSSYWHESQWEASNDEDDLQFNTTSNTHSHPMSLDENHLSSPY